MGRLVTIVTGGFADYSLEEMCRLARQMGYDGLELACWGNLLDPHKAATDAGYVNQVKDTLGKYGMQVYALQGHIIGQIIGDCDDPRLDNFAPPELAGKPEEMRRWATDVMLEIPTAAKNLGAKVITNFTGSPIWKWFYSFPQTTKEMIDAGFQRVYDLWAPIMAEFRRQGIKNALEVHPSEIAFDYYSTQRLLELFKDWPEFGLNFDPSHLLWQGVKPELFLNDFIDRVYHVHMKDAKVTLDGRSGLLGSHLDFGDLRRGWDFVSLGHGDIDFDRIIRVLNAHNYQGPLSVEWEDAGMDRIFGGTEACQFVRRVDFPASDRKFDEAIASKK